MQLVPKSVHLSFILSILSIYHITYHSGACAKVGAASELEWVGCDLVVGTGDQLKSSIRGKKAIRAKRWEGRAFKPVRVGHYCCCQISYQVTKLQVPVEQD